MKIGKYKVILGSYIQYKEISLLPNVYINLPIFFEFDKYLYIGFKWFRVDLFIYFEKINENKSSKKTQE